MLTRTFILLGQESWNLTRWLAIEATLDPRPGGACLQAHAGDDRRKCGPCHMRGEFLEVDPPNRVVFTWGFTEPEIGVPPGSSTVEVTLQPVGSGSLVRLVHRDLPPSEIEDHTRGWAEMLDRLAHTIITRANTDIR
ncbi:MAG: SRPBCC family protein [Egibacteraceae bacterium]